MSFVAMWHGEIADIPKGWHLCDGLDGTVDLRDLFVRGAGGIYNPGDTGGLPTHTHAFEGDGHSHGLPAGERIAAGTDYNDYTTYDPTVGTTDEGPNIPPYYALAFIEWPWGTL